MAPKKANRKPADVFDGPDITDDRAQWMAHFIELQRRLKYCAIIMVAAIVVSYIYASDIYAFLVHPLVTALGDNANGRRLIYTGLAETFITYLKLSFFAGIFVTFPFFLIQLWKFIAPGLYAHERRSFFPFLVATPVLFVMGGALVYYGILPFAWSFFLGFETPGGADTLPIELEARVSEYLSFVMTLILAFGVCFELPVFLVLLAQAGIITAQGLVKKRKFVIVTAFLVAAILTPPDVISQFGLAIPILLLYEVSILLIKSMRRRDEKDERTKN